MPVPPAPLSSVVLALLRSSGGQRVGAGTSIRADAAGVLGDLLASGRAPGSGLPVDVLLGGVGLAHRLVWSGPEDAAASGWRTDSGDGDELQQDVTRDFDEAHAVADKLVEARGVARAQGGAWLWPVRQGETSETWRTAWTPAAGTREVVALHVIEAEEATPATWVTDLASPMFGRPERVRATLRRDGASQTVEIHTSRLVYVPGARTMPGQSVRRQGYDVAVLDLYRLRIEQIEGASEAFARILDRLGAWNLTMRGAEASRAAGLDGDGGDVASRVQAFFDGLRSGGLAVTFDDDTLAWHSAAVSGTRDLWLGLLEALSVVEGRPLSRLFGQPPGGLSTDDQAGREAEDAYLGRERQVMARALLDLYRLALGEDATRRIVWPPLRSPSALEQAQVSLALAQRDAALIASAIIDPDEARARHADGEEVAELRLVERPEEDEGEALTLPALDEPPAAPAVSPDADPEA